MKILISGGNGFIARNLKNHIEASNIVCLSRSDLDFTKQDLVDSFFKNKFFDIVIHTATSGGSRLEIDDFNWVYENLSMYQNIIKNKNHFSRMINLTSGAELDRRFDINGESVFSRYPVDPYGLSKNLTSRLGFFEDIFFNVRIFNVFNHDEPETRMIRNNILNYISKKPLTIYQDRYMDFFHMDDFIKIMKYYCTENDLPKNLDCSYNQQTKLSNIVNIINDLGHHKSKIEITNEGLGNSYCGEPSSLNKLNLKLNGLDISIKNTYDILSTKISV